MASPVAESSEFVIAELTGTFYAVSVSLVQEIEPLKELTTVPGAPSVVVGITNVRGQVRAVLDARVILKQPPALSEAPPRGYMLLTEIDGTVYGILFDSVAEVLNVEGRAIKEGKIETPRGHLPVIDDAIIGTTL